MLLCMRGEEGDKEWREAATDGGGGRKEFLFLDPGSSSGVGQV